VAIRHIFVYAEWLHNQIHDLPINARSRNDLRLIQVGDKEREDFRKQHLPGAIYLDTSAIESAPSWNLLPDDRLELALLAHGVHNDRMVVLYGRDRLAVARVALALLYAGVHDVRVFWGGIDAWNRTGYALETGDNPPRPAAAFGYKLPAHPEFIVGMQQVVSLLAAKEAVVACVRTWEEFTGQISGYDYIEPKGRIPGSVWAPLPGDEAYRDQQSQSPELAAKLLEEIAEGWRAKGLTAEKEVVFYCGTGWRASEAFLYAYLLGWKDISIYDGGWLEWSAQADNPIEVGVPKSP
jgi:molybdopterin synthase sulfurtransferase